MSPSERCIFVSMDITFREIVHFYSEKIDLIFFESTSTSTDEAS
jgi:hypothetical protein